MRKKLFNRKTSFAAILYIPMVMFVVLFAAISCSTTKSLDGTVDSETVDFSHSSQFRKKGSVLVKPLFMSSERANMEFPDQLGFARMFGIPTTSAERKTLVLPEEDYLLQYVVFPGFDEDEFLADSIVNRYKYLEAVPHLADVVSNSNVRFASIRNGKANANFTITVPTTLLSSKWRVLLNPTLILNDSISNMKALLLTGEDFAHKQDMDEVNYENILKIIADSSEYGSSTFFNHKEMSKDLDELNKNYSKSYNDEWNRRVAFEQWKFERAGKDAFNASQKKAEVEKIRLENNLKAMEQVTRDFIGGKDTTGLHAQYLAEYNAKSKIDDVDTSVAPLTIDDVPKQYRDLFESGENLKDVKNNVLTPYDSILIAQYRYHFDEVQLNEVASIRKEDIYKEVVKYPKNEYTDLYLDTVIVDPTMKFEYRFNQSFPVSTGMDKIRMAVGGKVEAADLSSYRMAGSDTLTYYFTDLSALIDTTLAYSEVKLFRNVYDAKSVMPKYRAAQVDLDIEYMDNAAQVDSILTAYNKNRYERGLIIDSVILKASSSLEGDYDMNLNLSRKRSISMKEYLKKVLPPDANVEETFKAKYDGEDWEGARREVENHPDIKFKRQILKLMDEVVFPDETERNIAKRFGVDYGIIYYDIYPRLRKIDVIFNMSRPYMGVADSIYKVIDNEYAEGLAFMKKKDYRSALGVLAAKEDYNTALCYASLDEFDKAYEILRKIQSNDTNVEYLLALAAYNVGQKEEAAQHLLNACNLDFKKIYRIPLDIEATNLMREFELQDELRTILKENRAMGEDADYTDEYDDLQPKTYNPDDDEKVGSKIDDGEFIIVN